MKDPASPALDVSVIIVTYQSASCIGECLASVSTQEEVEFEILVVDNASADQTVSRVREFGEAINLVMNAENVGFGRACNQGFAQSRGRFLHLMNPDARLEERNALARLVRVMESNPRWGLAGTRVVKQSEGDESLPARSYPGHARARNNFARLPGEIAWVSGASMFVRRKVFQALGGFDPDFFLYSEETDLCLRLRKLGHEVGFAREIVVHHLGGVSEQGADPYDTWMRKMKGIHLFWRKHYASEDAARLVRRDLRRARFRMVTNGLLAKLQPQGASVWQKYRRYRAIRDASARFLEKA